MQQLQKIRDAAFTDGSAVLMARIVDRAGRRVRREQVAAIGYTIYELDPAAPEERMVVAGHDCVPLDVDDVFLDYLEIDRAWSVDVSGYNFRHEIHANDYGSFPKRYASYEFRYVLIPKFGEPALVQFYVRTISQ